MKAIRVHSYGDPEVMVWEDAPDPVPLFGEALVEIRAAGVNPADGKFRSGLLAGGAPKQMPFIPGMDIVGTVVALGQGTSGLAVGDKVLAMLFLGGNGAYAERVSLPAAWCARLPAGLDERLAAVLPTPATTAIEWIEDELGLWPGARVMITGATGAVGRIACYVAKMRGAQVTAAVREAQTGEVDYADDIHVLGGGQYPRNGWYDCIADTVGGETASALLPALKRGGTLNTVATTPVDNGNGLDVKVGFFGNHCDAARLGELADAVASGALQIAQPRVLAMSEAAKAHSLMEAGGAGKIVLVPDRLLQND